MVETYKETFKIIGTNAGTIAFSGMVFVIEDRLNAEKNDNLPHNTFVMANQSSACTLYIFLDRWHDLTKPDYVLFPSQQIAVSIEDGLHFSQIAVYNTHAGTDLAISELKYKVSTLKKVEV